MSDTPFGRATHDRDTGRVSGAQAIEVEGLRKRFGSVEALCGVSFGAETGTVLGLLGPNGAGKTTAVRILTTLLRPDGGAARVAGIDVLREPGRVRAVIGLAGQYAAVDENLTGHENLEMVGRLYHMPRRDSRARAGELLEEFGLSDAGGRLVRTYSGGMRRRLDLAAALVARPPILFLDEPTTGSTSAAVSRCGSRSRRSSPPARRCSSRRSTWRRPTASPTGSR